MEQHPIFEAARALWVAPRAAPRAALRAALWTTLIILSASPAEADDGGGWQGAARDVERSAAQPGNTSVDAPCEAPLLVTDLIKDVGVAAQREITALTAGVLSTEEENALGAQLHAAMTYEFGAVLDADPQLVGYLNALLRDLVPHMQRQDLGWEVHVVSGPQVNAFVLPGGRIYVFSALLEAIENEAQLVAVLAHEMGHAEMRHPVATLQYLKALGVWREDAPREAGLSGPLLTRLTTPLDSRREEAADMFAFDLMFSMGYSPYQGAQLMDIFASLYSDAPSPEPGRSFAGLLLDETRNLLTTHPHPGLRACRLRREASLRGQGQARVFYVGRENYTRRVPRSRQVF